MKQFLKLRIHRLIPEIILFALMIYYYGWIALLINGLIVFLELAPFNKIDERLNPWYKKYAREETLQQMEALGKAAGFETSRFDDDDFDDDYDGLDDTCPNCHTEYDQVDREYQICHLCGHHNDTDL
jgi:hypothetical protein